MTIVVHIDAESWGRRSAGSDGSYVRLGRTGWGVKVYRSADRAARACARQARAWSVGAAPRVGPLVSVRVDPAPGGRAIVRHGHLTEHARAWSDKRRPSARDRRAIEELRRALRSVRLSDHDVVDDRGGDGAYRNLGWVGERIVMLDFGDASS